MQNYAECRPTEVPAPVIRIAINCTEGYSYNWAAYVVKEFLEDTCYAQEKGRPFHYSWLIILVEEPEQRLVRLKDYAQQSRSEIEKLKAKHEAQIAELQLRITPKSPPEERSNAKPTFKPP